jgi:predicted glycoside hydrolase/deacetylase ChbG (UPF0249 family)
MLIINADDFGASASATDAICAAFDAGAITSASAMVWMGDSLRAAGSASERNLPTGLHLNLTLPFSAPDAPLSVRERQQRLTEYFTTEGWREDVGKWPARELLRAAIEDQLERFREQFGEPSHIDGHHHVHVHEVVLESLQHAWPIRPLLRTPAQVDARPSKRELGMRRRFLVPDAALAFEHLHPALGGTGLAVLDRARTICIEVMTHPQHPSQLQALLDHEWRATLAALPLGGYADLARPAADAATSGRLG